MCSVDAIPMSAQADKNMWDVGRFVESHSNTIINLSNFGLNSISYCTPKELGYWARCWSIKIADMLDVAGVGIVDKWECDARILILLKGKKTPGQLLLGPRGCLCCCAV